MNKGVKVDGLITGRKARAIGSDEHLFPTGEVIEFVQNGLIDEEAEFFSYIFTNGVQTQMLESHEFELID